MPYFHAPWGSRGRWKYTRCPCPMRGRARTRIPEANEGETGGARRRREVWPEQRGRRRRSGKRAEPGSPSEDGRGRDWGGGTPSGQGGGSGSGLWDDPGSGRKAAHEADQGAVYRAVREAVHEADQVAVTWATRKAAHEAAQGAVSRGQEGGTGSGTHSGPEGGNRSGYVTRVGLAWGRRLGRGAREKGEPEKNPTGTSGGGDKTATRRRPDRVAREREPGGKIGGQGATRVRRRGR